MEQMAILDVTVDTRPQHYHILEISLVSFLTMEKRPFSNPTFFDLSEIWHNESF
jgi:hypothetical protein